MPAAAISSGQNSIVRREVTTRQLSRATSDARSPVHLSSSHHASPTGADKKSPSRSTSSSVSDSKSSSANHAKQPSTTSKLPSNRTSASDIVSKSSPAKQQPSTSNKSPSRSTSNNTRNASSSNSASSKSRSPVCLASSAAGAGSKSSSQSNTDTRGASSAIGVGKSSTAPYAYTAIKDIKSRTSVNVFGVVKFVRPASRGRGAGEWVFMLHWIILWFTGLMWPSVNWDVSWSLKWLCEHLHRLGPDTSTTGVSPQTASRLVQPVLQGSQTWATDTETDRARYLIYNNRPHLATVAVRFNNNNNNIKSTYRELCVLEMQKRCITH